MGRTLDNRSPQGLAEPPWCSAAAAAAMRPLCMLELVWLLMPVADIMTNFLRHGTHYSSFAPQRRILWGHVWLLADAQWT